MRIATDEETVLITLYYANIQSYRIKNKPYLCSTFANPHNMTDQHIQPSKPVLAPPLPQSEFVLRNRRHRIDTILYDTLLLNAAFLLSTWLLNKLDVFLYREDFRFVGLIVGLNISWLIVSMYLKIYKWKERAPIEQELRSVIEALIIHAFVFSFIYYNIFRPSQPILLLASTYILAIPAVLGSRLINREAEKRKIKAINYIIIGGKNSNVKDILKAYNYRYAKKATCLGRFGIMNVEAIENIGTYEDIIPFLTRHPVNKVLYVYSRLSEDHVHHIMQFCQRRFIDFEIIPREHSLFPRGTSMEFHGNLPILVLKDEPLHRLRNKIIKRAFDLVFSSLVLLLIFPWLLPIIAFLIKKQSPGPVFFVQKRTGYFNKPFWCFKFRTMKVNEDSDNKQATRDDERITKIGAFLRKTNLDEFPQFINVFLGHMSVVGPRPHMLAHTEGYAELIDDFMIRHQVKPGITGWAQINGYRGPTETVDKMELRVACDVWYIENWSFLLDLHCILKTVTNALKGEENAF